jgi:solute carrier family 25 carnitine/acylcarnitine transporter 20/29
MSGSPAQWKDFASGTMGGMALVFAGHPLDTLKVRMQTMPRPDPGKPPLYKNALDCTLKTWSHEGLRGFYKGMSSPLTGVPPLYAVVFGAYGTSKNLLRKDPSDPLTVGQIFVAGCMTGIATTVVTTPIELVKARLQVQSFAAVKDFDGPIDCAKKILKRNGPSGLFKGTVATLWRDVPGTGVYFATYEFVRRLFIPEGKTANDLGPLSLLFAGGMAGVANWLAIFPIDVIKSKIQTDLKDTYLPGHRGMVTCAIQTVKQSGFAGLFPGLGPALLRSFPANAVCFLTVEMTTKLLNMLS